jgi:hypothetical protein
VKICPGGSEAKSKNFIGEEATLLDQPASELPQVDRRDPGRLHRLAVGALEPGGEDTEV